LNLKIQAAPALGNYVIGGVFRGVYSLSEKVHVGLYGNVGIFGVFSRRSAANYNSGYAMLPGIGGNIQVSNRVQLNAEIFLDDNTDGKRDFEGRSNFIRRSHVVGDRVDLR
jgi:hypothetical protein